MKKREIWRRTACFLLVTALLAGCGPATGPAGAGSGQAGSAASVPPPAASNPAGSLSEPEQSSGPEAGSQPETPEELSPVEQALASMTLREKVGQLFIVRANDLDRTLEQEQSGRRTDGTSALTDTMLATLEDYPVGGVIMFKENLISPRQITEFNAALQGAVDIPLFIAVDEEGGTVARLANHQAFDLPKYKSAAAVGAGGDPAAALEMGRTIGAYLKEYGFNMDFAPDADVNTNPANPVIGNRAFSSDGETAAAMAAAMAEGLRAEGVTPVFKHFPGHGDTAEDSHKGLAVSHKTEEEMLACEWLPFQMAGEGDCVMVGHIAAPEITGDMTPASLSHDLVTGVLREQLGFRGLVVTDSMEMGAVTGDYGPGEAAVAAILAGCDVVLMPGHLREVFDAVLAAVEDGTISQARLDESVRRVLEYKL